MIDLKLLDLKKECILHFFMHLDEKIILLRMMHSTLAPYYRT